MGPIQNELEAQKRKGQVSGSIMKSEIIQTRLSTEFYVIKTIIRGVKTE